MARSPLGDRLMNYDGASLEEGLQLAADLIEAQRWTPDVAAIVIQVVQMQHGDEGVERLRRAVEK